MKGAMLRALGLLGLSLSLFACAGVRDVYVSVPHIEGHSENAVQDGSIHLDGLTLVLRPQNILVTRDGVLLTFPLPPAKIGGKISEDERKFLSSYYPDHNPSTFYLEVAFISEIGGYTFDSHGTALVLHDGRQVSPQSCYGPFIAYRWKKRIPEFLCRRWPENRVLQDPLEVNRGVRTCLALSFDVPPPLPGEPFSIQLGELSHEGTAVTLPIVEYRDSKKESWAYQ